MLQTLLDSCAALGVPLTAAQAEQLCDFGARLLEQNRVMNLTAITEPQAVAKLHFADCLALLRIVPFSGKRVIDVGCGAGFPGVPLKLGEPSLDLTLLDSLGKRVTWLEATLRDMGVPAQCVCSRAEDYAAKAREQYDIATSRAVARLNILAELCLPFVKPGGYFLAMKAAAAAEELEEAKRGIARLGGRVEKTETYNIDGAPRCVIVIRKERPTPPAYPRRRGPCRDRSRSRGRAAGAAGRRVHDQSGRRGQHALQPGHRRHGQRPSRARARRPRRRDGPRGGRLLHPVPHAQPRQGPGRALPAGAG